MSDPKDKTLLLTWVCWQQGRIEDLETFAGDMEECHNALSKLIKFRKKTYKCKYFNLN